MSRRQDVLDAAERILEDEGPEALTMRRLAEALSMRAPSLYKHVASKTEIEAALQERALRWLADALADAVADVPAGPAALAELAPAYRGWALAHPRLYALATERPLRRELLPAGVEETAAAPLLAAVGGDQTLARAVWGAAHGLVALELAGRFPADADLDAAWERMLTAFGAAGAVTHCGESCRGLGVAVRPRDGRVGDPARRLG